MILGLRRTVIAHRLIIVSVIFAMNYGCSTASVLISSEDKIFEETQERLARTMNEIDNIQASLAEKRQFIQAESFYRYRFQPPVRSITSYFAEAAAAVTDFPAFQALAASLDIGELRLRSADSAVQLWETLLIKYPKSQLRPLTLYRLGWAYRNTGIEGLPKSSPNEAFDSLINEFPNSPFTPLAESAKRMDWKSKRVASSRSIIPGLGQLYVGETKNAVTRIGVASAAAVAILMPVYIASHRKRPLAWNQDWGLLVSGLSGLIVLSWDFTSSYQDSMRAVIDFNEKQESDFNKLHPDAP